MSEDLFQRALELHQTGQFAEAEALYKKILVKEPARAEVLHLLGILAGQQGDYAAALKWIQAAIQQEPDSATFYNSLGNVYRQSGQIEQAIKHYQTALKLQPDSPSANNNLGILFYRQNQLDEAIKYYQAAIALKPDYADAHFNLSTALTAQQKFTEAKQQLEIALRIQPEHPQAHGHLGQILLQENRPLEAVAHFEERLRLDPDHAETHHQLAVALTQLNQLEQAISHYEKTLKLQPDHVEALHNLGALYLTQRQPDMALRCYLRLLSIQPDLDTYYNLGVIFSYQDRHNEAINYLQEALRLEPDFYNAHINLGAVYLKKEDLQQAAHHYEAALKLRPNDPELLYILAAISQKTAPTSAPAEYVEHLFDQYAPHFEKHLQEYLHYQVPDLLFKAVTAEIGSQQEDWVILELGCGTGLCGVPFRRLAHKLIGVDLSEKMLEAAKQKQVYDELRHADINAVLQESHDIDLVLAGDVFGYVGDLDETFALTRTALKPDGWFAFTVEKTFSAPFYLQSNARFAHSREYIESLALEHNFTIVRCDNAVLRQQKQQPVEGYLFLLRPALIGNGGSR
jgi:predicted TPR repeat methyltransferase